MPQLVPPSAGLRRSYVESLREAHAEGRHLGLDPEVLGEPDVFAAYVAALLNDVERPGEPDRFVEALTGVPSRDAPRDGFVPQTILWWVEGDEFIGRVHVRHRLTEELLHHGGHIGYEVRPGARGRGHATAMLAAALPVAAALGIDEALVDCDVTNVASRRVIEKNGGRLEREEAGALFFRVPTGRGSGA